MMEPITIAITAADRQQAYEFAQQQLTQERSQQVYCNTLAVLVTQRFLQMLGIDTDLTASHSWNPLEQQLENIADLYIPSLQSFLECRCLSKSDRKCYIPPEVWSERLGYVMIDLDEPYKEAQVVGFVESVCVAELPRSYFQTLDVLLECLTSSPQPQAMVQLSHWLKHTFEYDWRPPKNWPKFMKEFEPQRSDFLIRQQVEQLYYRQSNHGVLPNHLNLQEALVNLIQTTPDDEIRWQSAELLWELNPKHPACPVISAKDLGIYLLGQAIVLIVGILPKSDGRMLILLRLYPSQKQSHLPAGLKLIGLDEIGNLFFEVESRQKDAYIQFKFTADMGDRFSVRVVLDDASFTEDFII
ncbi:DUF1822 family protein [Nostoc sp. MS1]|uniref:DUF1822 family protein n=1 Tax=Nostoc sp. MS1 TaxID=2764711 RepID=UPI001CC69620|nr:DUF1822 family protein [Nostoc sp. MS1]BCL35249.1 hypothetical protein NSMS1_16960 [Nostoc sp. MS1]